MKLIAEEWAMFERHASIWTRPMEHKQMKLAFYAGAQAIISSATNALSHGDDRTTAALNMLLKLQTEVLEFTREGRNGKT